MAYPQGINHRLSAIYVTDGVNEDYGIEARGPYPWTTAQGNNVGWEIDGPADITNTQHRNRNAGNDARIAGMVGVFTASRFRFDLPSAGNYNIGLGAGDANYAQAVGCDVYDSGSSLGTLTTGSTSGAQKFKDATDTEYTNVTWPTSQSVVSKTFSTTICRFQPTGDVWLCHMYVEAGAAPASGPLLRSPIQSNLRWR
jgi:hypothetical protein